MKLRPEPVPNKTLGYTYRIRYWENGKNRVLPKSEHQVFKTLEEAKAWCKQANERNTQSRLFSHVGNSNEIAFKNDLIGNIDEVITFYLSF